MPNGQNLRPITARAHAGRLLAQASAGLACAPTMSLGDAFLITRAVTALLLLPLASAKIYDLERDFGAVPYSPLKPDTVYLAHLTRYALFFSSPSQS